MQSGSWASYQAASSRERDDDEPSPPGPTAPPDWYAVEWYEPLTYRDTFTDENGNQVEYDAETQAPVTRLFTGASHGKPYEAARRWAQAMADRKGVAWLKEGWDGFPDFDGEQRFVRKAGAADVRF